MSGDDPDYSSFEERIREIAREVSRSMERMADFDIDEVAQSFGVDPQRARDLADAAARWFAERAGDLDVDRPLWSTEPQREPEDDVELPRSPGPHPLDLPSEAQGVALSALESGRWMVEPGSSVIASSGEGPVPDNALGLVGELRARDWIAADGTVTVVGRNALVRWMESTQSE
jgi:hypothetical protein